MHPTDDTTRARRAALPRVLLAALLAALAAILMPAAASARKNVHDPRGDVAISGHLPDADYDIVDAKVARHGKRIKVAVKVAGNAVAGGDHTHWSSGIQVEIDAKLRKRGDDCNGNSRDAYGRAEYILSTRGGPVLIDCTGKGIPVGKRVGFKDRPHKLIFTFNRHKIGNPKKFRWYASTGEDRPSDLAPDLNGADGPRYTGFRVRAGGHHKRHHSSWRHCATHHKGAGVYRLRAKRAGCKTAHKVSKHWIHKGWMHPHRKWHGWKCQDKLVGAEDFKASCKKRKHGRRKKVKFKYGS